MEMINMEMACANVSNFGPYLTPPAELVKASPKFLGMSDFLATTVMPIVGFWLVSGFYETIEYLEWFPQYRAHPSREELSRNLISRAKVFQNAITMHIIQVIFALVANAFYPSTNPPRVLNSFGSIEYFGISAMKHAAVEKITLDPRLALGIGYTLNAAYLLLRQFLAFFILDTWGYWVHYGMHVSPYLYRTIHSIHHQNYVPYSFAAGYNHYVEGFSDVLAAYTAVKVIGLSDREAVVFLTIAAVKAVDDHSGLSLPYNPFRFWRWLFGNGPVYHTVHHQRWGFKSNFEIFFCFWDHWNDTIYRGSRKLPGEVQDNKEKQGNSETRKEI